MASCICLLFVWFHLNREHWLQGISFFSHHCSLLCRLFFHFVFSGFFSYLFIFEFCIQLCRISNSSYYFSPFSSLNETANFLRMQMKCYSGKMKMRAVFHFILMKWSHLMKIMRIWWVICTNPKANTQIKYRVAISKRKFNQRQWCNAWPWFIMCVCVCVVPISIVWIYYPCGYLEHLPMMWLQYETMSLVFQRKRRTDEKKHMCQANHQGN